MSLVVGAMVAVLVVVAGTVVAVLIEMGSRSWRWAVKLLRLARAGDRYLDRRVSAFLQRDFPDLSRQRV